MSWGSAAPSSIPSPPRADDMMGIPTILKSPVQIQSPGQSQIQNHKCSSAMSSARGGLESGFAGDSQDSAFGSILGYAITPRNAGFRPGSVDAEGIQRSRPRTSPFPIVDRTCLSAANHNSKIVNRKS